jgi:hypothetical protein
MIIHQPNHPDHRLSFRQLTGIGGDRLVAGLARGLDDGYHYLPQVAAGGPGSRIDAVVVGSGGTWAISTGMQAGRFLKRNGHWYRWNRSTESWIPWDAEPVSRARLAGHRLEAYLERASLPAIVEPVLVAPSNVEISWAEDQRPGIHVHADLSRLARRIARDEVLIRPQVDRIVALLDPRQPLPRLATSTQG